MKSMRFSNKLFRLSICMILVASLFTACGGNGGTPSTGEASDKPGATGEESPNTSEKEENLIEEFTYNGSAPVTKEPKEFSILATNGASLIYDFENMTWWQEALQRANIQLDIELVDSSA